MSELDKVSAVMGTLLSRAGVTRDLVEKGKPSIQFAAIMNSALMIHQGKEVLYGDYMKTHRGDPVNFALMEHYADIKRKFVRIEHFVKRRIGGTELPLEDHLDSMMDICVYAAIGVELIMHFMEQENGSSLRPGDDRATEANDGPKTPAGDSPVRRRQTRQYSKSRE